MIKLPEPQTCFSIGLRKGSLTIGILTIVCAVINMVLWAAGLGPFAFMALMEKYHYLNGECEDDCRRSLQMCIFAIAVFVLVFESIQIIASSLLVHGVRKDRPRLIISFMVWQIVRVVVSFAMAVPFAVAIKSAGGLVFTTMAVFGLLSALNIYFMLVVNAYRMKMSRDQNEEPLQLDTDT